MDQSQQEEDYQEEEQQDTQQENQQQPQQYTQQETQQQQQQYQTELNQYSFELIDISVQNPVIKQDGLQKFTSYVVKGKDRLGLFEISRRYNEFNALRETLFLRWPGCFVPRIPGKKTMQGNDQEVIGDRLKFLNAFCNKISKQPHLFYSPEFNQLFLRNRDQDVSKILLGMTQCSSVELIQKYQVHFGELQGKEIDAVLIEKICNFTVYLTKSIETLKRYKVFVKQMIDNQKKLNEQVTLLVTTSLTDYEKTCLSTYVQKNDEELCFNNSKISELLKQKYAIDEIFQSLNLEIFYDLIRLEIKDCRAFMQQIQIRDETEQKRLKLENKVKELQIDYQNALQGKQSIKSIFTKGTHEDWKTKLNLKIQDTNNEIENLKVLYDIISAIIGFIEIKNFRNDKQQAYKNIMTTVCDLEIQSIESQRLFWEFISLQTGSLLENLKS